MEERLYLKCTACLEVFEADEPQVAKAHENNCDFMAGDFGGPLGTYELLTESEAF